MKFLFDFFPVLAFFITYFVAEARAEGQGFYVATAVLIAASIIQVSVYWIIKHRFEKMHIITLVVVLILGGATLLYQDKHFVMWKPTAVNWLFALVFLGSHFIGGKTMVQRMMGHALSLPAHAWSTLNMSWIIFFVAMGILNIYVAYNFSEAFWVKFKLFGILGCTILFAIGQSIYMSRFMSEVEEKKE
jgi:intracellular septation protein